MFNSEVCKFYLPSIPLLAPIHVPRSLWDISKNWLYFPLLPFLRQNLHTLLCFWHPFSSSLMIPKGSDSEFLSITTSGTEVLTVAKKGLRRKLANAWTLLQVSPDWKVLCVWVNESSSLLSSAFLHTCKPQTLFLVTLPLLTTSWRCPSFPRATSLVQQWAPVGRLLLGQPPRSDVEGSSDCRSRPSPMSSLSIWAF